jgi:hypothetical protein
MTRGELTAVGFAMLVDEFRRVGLTICDAVDAVYEFFGTPPETDEQRAEREAAEALEAERAAGRRNEMIMQGFMGQVGMTSPPVRRKEQTA